MKIRKTLKIGKIVRVWWPERAQTHITFTRHRHRNKKDLINIRSFVLPSVLSKEIGNHIITILFAYWLYIKNRFHILHHFQGVNYLINHGD